VISGREAVRSKALEYFKYHALGNDYLVIDPKTNPIELTPQAIRLICHRHFGIGSDGILFGPLNEPGQIALKIFNPDGSEAEKSGNGIRIFSRYLIESGQSGKLVFDLLTLGGLVRIEALKADGSEIKVDMGTVTFWSERIPVAGPAREVIEESLSVGNTVCTVTCLSIGNPHCVIPMSEISKETACKLGPLVENHALFPNRINLQLLKVLDRRNIQIEIWERGAGYTLASGSSSCAAASAAYKLGLVDNELTVQMPGGKIGIQIAADGHVFMQGSVSSVAKGHFTEEFATAVRDARPFR
jgi:diaminopimelate epimerase